MRWRIQRRRLAALAVGAGTLLVLSACGTDGSAVPTASVPVLPTGTPSKAVTAVVPVLPDDAALVASCVQYVPAAAFTGSVHMQALWDAVGQDPTALADR